ncbi:MAG: phage head closure protein [Rhabdaerophilum sp.]
MARPMTLPVGARRKRLTLEAPIETFDAMGGAAFSYQPIATLWGEVIAKSGRETSSGERLEGEIETRIKVRFRADIDARMRFRLGQRIFAIRAAFDAEGLRKVTTCLVDEVTP